MAVRARRAAGRPAGETRRGSPAAGGRHVGRSRSAARDAPPRRGHAGSDPAPTERGGHRDDRRRSPCARAGPRVHGATFERLREQAALQHSRQGEPLPRWKVLPPTADAPRRGLALLPRTLAARRLVRHGGLSARRRARVPLRRRDEREGRGGVRRLLGARRRRGERQAFESFVRWITKRRRRDPGMHVYHYAAYERSALRRLVGRYGVCEDEVDPLLRDDVLVDLYAVVRRRSASAAAPTRSRSSSGSTWGPRRRARPRSSRAATRSSSTCAPATPRPPDSRLPRPPCSPTSPTTTATTASRRCELRDFLLGIARAEGVPSRRRPASKEPAAQTPTSRRRSR